MSHRVGTSFTHKFRDFKMWLEIGIVLLISFLTEINKLRNIKLYLKQKDTNNVIKLAGA